jgi:multiple sugar transport system permease protein
VNKQESQPLKGRAGSFAARKNLFPYLLWLPTLVLLLFMVVYPTIYLLWNSLYQSNAMTLGTSIFVGLGNFVDVFMEPELRAILVRTIVFVVGALGLEFLLGTILALLVSRYILRGQALFKILFITPMLMTPVAIGLVWRWMYDPTKGIINYTLGLVGISGPSWLGDPTAAMAAVIIAEVWQWTPFVFLGVLAGLSALPNEPIEAAKIDGANGWQVFRYVTLPLLAPILSVVFIFRFIDVFKAFDIIYVLTEGGPGNATSILPWRIYQEAFRYYNTGYASALSWILLIFIIAVYTWLINRINKGEV